MKIEQVAAITYTIRDHVKDRAGVIESMRKLRGIGYQAVQISGMAADVTPAELKQILADEGLVCCATHESSAELFDKPGEIASNLNALGCAYTAYPWPHQGEWLKSAEGIEQYCAKFNEVGRVLKDAGITLCYHNHAHEFRRVAGKLILEHFYDSTNPELLQGELDTYWVQFGGANPVSWIERLSGRLPLLHMKDYGMKPGEHAAIYTEVGNGNLEWNKIVAAADAAGCKWFIVEQDTCPGDPFDSLKQSFDYIKANLAE